MTMINRAVTGLLVGVAIFFVFLSVLAVHDMRYFPSHEDETIYFNSARLFCETGSLKAPSMIDEDQSIVFGANWYGIFYGLFYGLIMKLFGFHAAIFIFINLVLIVISLLIILKSGLPSADRILAALFFLSLYSVTNYTFTFFPEALHLMSGVWLTAILLNLDRQYAAGRPIGRIVAVYFLVALLFSLLRITAVFWLPAILAYARSQKSFLICTTACACGVIAVVLYMHFCTAPMWVSGGAVIEDAVHLRLGSFLAKSVKMLVSNIKDFLRLMDVTSFTCFASTVLATVYAIASRKRILLAAAVVALCHYGVLLAFYDPAAAGLNRLTACLMPLLIMATIYSSISPMKIALAVLVLAAFPHGIMQSRYLIAQHRGAFDDYTVARAEQVRAFDSVRNMVNPDRENIVLWLYNEHGYPRNCSEVMIPLSTPNGRPIRYTTNVIRDPAQPDSVRFKTYGKLKIDYVLSRRKLSLHNLEPVSTNAFFHFYRRLP